MTVRKYRRRCAAGVPLFRRRRRATPYFTIAQTDTLRYFNTCGRDTKALPVHTAEAWLSIYQYDYRMVFLGMICPVD